MSNEITAYFKGTTGVAESVYQHDYGMIMNIDGLTLSDTFDVHFEKSGSSSTITAVGSNNRVAIPNDCLAVPGKLTAYIYTHTGSHDGETAYVVTFQVINRARPDDDITDATEESNAKAIVQLQTEHEEDVSKINNNLDAIENNIDDVEAAATALTARVTTAEGDIDSLEAQFTTVVSAVTTDTEVTNIRVGDDGVTYSTAGEAVRKQFSDVKSALTKPINIALADVTDGYYIKKNNTTAQSASYSCVKDCPYNGSYGIALRITCIIYDVPSFVFLDKDKNVIEYINSENASDYGIISMRANQSVSLIVPNGTKYFSFSYLGSVTSTNVFDISVINTGKTIYDQNAETQIATIEDDTNIFAQDVEYNQSDNLYDWHDNYVLNSRWSYDAGTPYTGETTHVRNLNPILLDSAKEYNIQVKFGYAGALYVYKYASDGTYLGYEWAGSDPNSVVHVSGLGSVNFSIADYLSRYPNTPPYVMVWESNNSNQYTEWLEYGEHSTYQKIKQKITPDNLSDITEYETKHRFDYIFNQIAYSNTADDDAAINTAEHFINCAKLGYTTLKTDVQLTSDGKLVCCHDDGFTLNEDGYVISYNPNDVVAINSMTLAECTALQHNALYDGVRQNVTSFEKYIQICKKYGVSAFITIRHDNIDDVVTEMFAILEKYKMVESSIINSFTYSSLQAVRNENKYVLLSYVQNYQTPLTTAKVDLAIKIKNCIICTYSFSEESTDVSILDNNVQAYNYAIENDVPIYEGQIPTAISIYDLLPYGISGAQMLTKQD